MLHLPSSIDWPRLSLNVSETLNGFATYALGGFPGGIFELNVVGVSRCIAELKRRQ
jgi:hypothetical protein